MDTTDKTDITAVSEEMLNEPEGLEFKGEGPMRKGGAKKVIVDMPIKKIILGKNSRMDIRDEEIEGLMSSIKETGLLQPIGVSKNGNSYEICYGNRRFLACSKLGYKTIPAIIYNNQTQYDTDLKNLTENLQRRNIGLVEAGRYMHLLKDKPNNLSTGEIAVRLGVSKGYVSDCLSAYEKVPDKFKKDVVTGITRTKGNVATGKVSVREANAIISVAKKYRLDDKQKAILFDAAKNDDNFQAPQIKKYAEAVKRGSKNPTSDVKPVVYCNIAFYLERDFLDKIESKYVTNGSFSSMQAVFRAILEGKLSCHLKLVDKSSLSS